MATQIITVSFSGFTDVTTDLGLVAGDDYYFQSFGPGDIILCQNPSLPTPDTRGMLLSYGVLSPLFAQTDSQNWYAKAARDGLDNTLVVIGGPGGDVPTDLFLLDNNGNPILDNNGNHILVNF